MAISARACSSGSSVNALKISSKSSVEYAYWINIQIMEQKVGENEGPMLCGDADTDRRCPQELKHLCLSVHMLAIVAACTSDMGGVKMGLGGQMKKRQFWLLISVGILFASDPVVADKLHLSNGDVITGKAIRMEDRKLILKTEYAGEISVDWQKVVKLSTDAPIKVMLRDGTALTGTAKEADKKYWSLSDSNNWLIYTRQGLRLPLYKGLTATFQYNYDYDNEPSEDAEKKWDSKLLFPIGWQFKNWKR
jgi:hypothetical protein